ncbi:hypothetical protein RHMOL_Rhmol06G0186600 [Rhododendron molle]|uniref:Uncharacterized protein n=1 Tax=Rhododendron molle TaxID=49168 RepID=A0ACC0NDM8_RHOML|nr:hypothetical protein RHMOL_Rhmol06G0186600 [Rhododendron molle]
MFPILDQWVEGGRNVDLYEIKTLIKHPQRIQALQPRSPGQYHKVSLMYTYMNSYLSEWMAHRRNLALSPGDIAVQLDLVSKVHGLEQAEKYFSNIPGPLKTFQAVPDINGMDKLLSLMEANRLFTVDWHAYITAANGYMKAGVMEKSLTMLKKSEQPINGWRENGETEAADEFRRLLPESGHLSRRSKNKVNTVKHKTCADIVNKIDGDDLQVEENAHGVTELKYQSSA